jgi:hypothetical protein
VFTLETQPWTIANLIAIDTHTHAEVSCWNPFDNYGEEYDRAADKYFRTSKRPTIQESIDYYRERKIGFVMFTRRCESQPGSAPHPERGDRRGRAREPRHDDVPSPASTRTRARWARARPSA